MRVLAKTIGVVLTLAYPLGVLWALTHLGARALGVLGLCLAVPWMAWRLRSAARDNAMAILRVPLLVMALLLLGALLDDPRFALALPVLINAALLLTFATSLWGEMPIVERFARAHEAAKARAASPAEGSGAAGAAGDLSDAQVRHCRQATVAWCIFFVFNGAIAALLAVSDLRIAWAVYNGAIAYGLVGLMFAGEYLVRLRRFGTR